MLGSAAVPGPSSNAKIALVLIWATSTTRVLTQKFAVAHHYFVISIYVLIFLYHYALIIIQCLRYSCVYVRTYDPQLVATVCMECCGCKSHIHYSWSMLEVRGQVILIVLLLLLYQTRQYFCYLLPSLLYATYTIPQTTDPLLWSYSKSIQLFPGTRIDVLLLDYVH